jgi:hypothetical protein
MKFICLLISFLMISYLKSQNNNVYVVMPKTINVNIVEPMRPVPPVNYGELSSGVINELNNIAENRERQKAAFENITNKAISDLQKIISLGYSSSINSKMYDVQQKSINNINTYYSSLTTGQIDPIDYSNVLNQEVNNYINFTQLINNFNQNFINTINSLKANNKFIQIEAITNIIDLNCNNFQINPGYSYEKKTRRYSYYNNLKLTYQKSGVYKSQTEFFNSISIPVNKIRNIEFDNETDKLGNDLKIDLSIQEKVDFSTNSLNVPSTFKLKQNTNNYWEKNYSDGTKFVINLFVDNTNFKKTYKSNYDAILDLKSKIIAANNRPSIGISCNDNLIITFTRENSALNLGDKIINIDNLKIENNSQIENAKQGKEIGDTLNFLVRRNNTNKLIAVVLEKLDNNSVGYDIIINGRTGFLSLKNQNKQEYGEVIKSLIVSVLVPYKDDIFGIQYIITPSNDLSLKDNNQIYNIFKPLIKSINDSIIFN